MTYWYLFGRLNCLSVANMSDYAVLHCGKLFEKCKLKQCKYSVITGTHGRSHASGVVLPAETTCVCGPTESRRACKGHLVRISVYSLVEDYVAISCRSDGSQGLQNVRYILLRVDSRATELWCKPTLDTAVFLYTCNHLSLPHRQFATVCRILKSERL